MNRSKHYWKLILKSRSYISDNGCWIWDGTIRSNKRTKKRYGSIQIGGKKYSVHRLSFWCYNDFSIADSTKHILHKCDNTQCINPNHLFKGSTPLRERAKAYK